MAHSGDGSQWKEDEPTNDESISDGALELRDLRQGVNIRLQKEHVACGSASAGGEHKAGSTRIFYQTTAPTARPDGSSLTSSDNGRLWMDSATREVYVYVHPSWLLAVVQAEGVADNTISTNKLVNLAVTEAKIAANAVSAGKLASILDLSTNTLTFPSGQTLLLPTVASFTNAQHNHSDAASGGALVITKWNWGSYSGNGSSTRDITTGSNGAFTTSPKFVLITYAGSTYMKIPSLSGALGVLLDDGSHYNDVITLGTNKFTVHSSRTNYSSRTYYWFSLGF